MSKAAGPGPAERVVVARAREDFLTFLEFVGKDERGDPFTIRALDRFIWEWTEQCWTDGCAAGVMLPMGSGKTTHAAWRIAWEIGRDPNLLVSLVTASFDDSCERVALVRQILELPAYRKVFPALRMGSKDGQEGFTLRRDGYSHNLTVSAHGVITGEGVRTHFLVLDDVCNQKNTLHEPASRKKVLHSVRGTWTSRLKLGLGDRPRAMWLQTSFHEADAAAVTRKDAQSQWRWMVVRAEPPFDHLTYEDWREGVRTATGTIPLHVPRAQLEHRWHMMGPPTNARGLANRPLSDADQPFKERHVGAEEPLGLDVYKRRVAFADPAGDATKVKRGDPDWCAFVAIGQREDGRWEVYFASRVRDAPSRQAHFIALSAKTCRPNRLYQEAIKDEAMLGVVKDKLREMGVGLVPEPVKPQTRKEVRIRDVLEPHLEAGQLLVCGSRFRELRDEMLSFPAGAHDDLVDALAGAYEKVATGGPMRHRSSLQVAASEEDGSSPTATTTRAGFARGRSWDRGLWPARARGGLWRKRRRRRGLA